MLSISPLSDRSAQYYLDLAKQDYYLAGGEPPGVWMGDGASKLGLHGLVERQPFLSVFDGVSPFGSDSLVQRRNGQRHHPGWDLTFSAPKSVSVLWSQADESTRRTIQQLHFEAVRSALDYIEDQAATTRRGTGGIRQEPVRLVVAGFEHGTSRAQDPQLHSHALVLNIGVRADGTTGAIQGPLLFVHKMAAGAVYRAELALLLQRELGLAVQRDERSRPTDRHPSALRRLLGLSGRRLGDAFEIVGVPRSLVREFSKRRLQIESALRSKGLSSAQAASIATLETRSTKDHVARQELLRQWQEVGSTHGFTRSEVLQLLHKQTRELNTEAARRQAVDEAIKTLTDTQSYFTERELVRFTAEEGQWRGLGAAGVRAAVRQRLAEIDEIVPVGEVTRERVYTTREMLELEDRLLEQAERLRDDTTHLVGRLPAGFVGLGADFTDEQREAFYYLTREKGGVQCIDGYAGTGKTSLLKATGLAWQLSGYKVVGVTVSAKAARGLQEQSGIRSVTLEQLLYNLDRPADAMVGYHYRQLSRALGHGRNQTPDEAFLTLTKDTIVVLDEASMVGTRDFGRLMDHVTEAGSGLKAIGGRSQLQAIEAGNPFAALVDRLQGKRLTDVRRQKELWARQAVRDMAEGRSEEALRAYAERGLISVSGNREEAQEELVRAWRKHGLSQPAENVVFTATRQEADYLNRRIQQERLRSRRLGDLKVTVGDTEFRVGDRVAFLRNHRTLGLENGMLGTIRFVEPVTRNLMVRLDDGRLVGVPLLRYRHIALGYAITTHKGQGATVENAYVLMGGNMQDKEMTYVQLSRARGETRIFTDEHEAGPELKALAKQIGKSREKALAATVRDRSARVEPEEQAPGASAGTSGDRTGASTGARSGRRDEGPSPAGATADRPEPPLVVLDGPTLEKGLREASGFRADCLALVRQGRLRLAVDAATAARLQESGDPAARELTRHAVVVHEVKREASFDGRWSDADGQMKATTLNTAISADASYVVTDDRELLALEGQRAGGRSTTRAQLRDIRIVTPAELVRLQTVEREQNRERGRETDRSQGRSR